MNLRSEGQILMSKSGAKMWGNVRKQCGSVAADNAHDLDFRRTGPDFGGEVVGEPRR